MSRDPLRPRDAYRRWTTISTRWHDNDPYGHVNNTVYYAWFDTAVNTFLVEEGLLDIEHGALIGLVVETGCRYAAPLAFPQPVDIGLAVARLGSSSVTFHLGVFPATGDAPAAEGHFTHVYVDRDTRRPAPLPADWRARMQTLA